MTHFYLYTNFCFSVTSSNLDQHKLLVSQMLDESYTMYVIPYSRLNDAGIEYFAQIA